MGFVSLSAPGAEDGECDGLGEGGGFEGGGGGLSIPAKMSEWIWEEEEKRGKGKRTCLSMASRTGAGPVTNPSRRPAERTLEKESKRMTRPPVFTRRRSLGVSGAVSRSPRDFSREK